MWFQRQPREKLSRLLFVPVDERLLPLARDLAAFAEEHHGAGHALHVQIGRHRGDQMLVCSCADEAPSMSLPTREEDELEF